MRDKDANTAWAEASDATLEERRYYCQSWRADVVALLESDGDVSEWIRYSAYGEATVYPFVNGDFDADGDVDGDDTIAFSAAWDSNANAADVDRANGVDGDDVIAFAAAWDAGYASTAWTAGGGLPTGAGQLSVTSGNRIGYAGYQFDPATEQYHVRHRVYSPEMGRWTRRDPIGYVGGRQLLEYVAASPVSLHDPSGLIADTPLPTDDVRRRWLLDESECPSGYHYDPYTDRCVRGPMPQDPRQTIPDDEWYSPRCRGEDETRGYCFRYAMGCPLKTPMPFSSWQGQDWKIHAEPRGPEKFPAGCAGQIRQLEFIGLWWNGMAAPPLPCPLGYNIAVYSHVGKRARHYRRQGTDGHWWEIYGCDFPRMVGADLTHPVITSDGTRMEFCGFFCKPFSLRPKDILLPGEDLY